MRDIYARLKSIGFDRTFVRSAVLPEWWDDALAEDPTTRTQVELILSARLGIPFPELADRDMPLSLSNQSVALFKRHSNSTEEALRPAVTLARRVASGVLRAMPGLGAPEALGLDAERAREAALDLSPSGVVELPALVELSWRMNVPVVPILNLPNGAKKADAMALNVDGRPVIVIASGRKSSAHLQWYLAHELGHVASGHLAQGDRIDVDFGEGDEDRLEVDADRYATSVLFGKPSVRWRSQRRIAGPRLAAVARQIAKDHGCAPSAFVTNYAYTMSKQGKPLWGAAQNALVALGAADGGYEVLTNAIASRIDYDLLDPDEADFVEAMVAGTR